MQFRRIQAGFLERIVPVRWVGCGPGREEMAGAKTRGNQVRLFWLGVKARWWGWGDV